MSFLSSVLNRVVGLSISGRRGMGNRVGVVCVWAGVLVGMGVVEARGVVFERSRVDRSREDWFDAEMWMPMGVPTASDTVVIDRQTSVLIDGREAEAETLFLGSTADFAKLDIVAGGTLSTVEGFVDSHPNNFGHLDLNGEGSSWTTEDLFLRSGRTSITDGAALVVNRFLSGLGNSFTIDGGSAVLNTLNSAGDISFQDGVLVVGHNGGSGNYSGNLVGDRFGSV